MSTTNEASPLASWNDGGAKSQILDFVARVTEQGSPDFVPPAERIATFDNDGTLWCEQPMQTQVFFLIDREEEFDPIARNWLAKARHPKFGRLFKECTYRPQLELLSLLRRNGFKIYIVTGGGIDFVRACSEEVYDIPREQVVGSSQKLRFDVNEGLGGVMKLAELNTFNDHESKPQNIALHVGRRPILAFGNSDGDLAMLRYTKTGKGRRLALLLHHDDAEREVAYDREFRLSPLNEALEKADYYGITVVSMKRDWDVIF